MWAWLSTTASIFAGSKGKVRLRSMVSARLPWNRPHSRSRRAPLISKRNIDPVVVRAAPRKWIRMRRKVRSQMSEARRQKSEEGQILFLLLLLALALALDDRK